MSKKASIADIDAFYDFIHFLGIKRVIITRAEVESNELHLLALLKLSSFFVYLYFFK